MTKKMSIKEFKDGGYLQEVNRQFFHPLGLALWIQYSDDETACYLHSIWDSRDDPQGFVFGPGMINQELLNKVRDEMSKKLTYRSQTLGFAIQTK